MSETVRLNVSRDWCMRMAELEGDAEIGAGAEPMDPEIAAAEQRGREEVLREVARHPSPVVVLLSQRIVYCNWCSWTEDCHAREPHSVPKHPDNGCLWPRAVAAQGKADAPSAGPTEKGGHMTRKDGQ